MKILRWPLRIINWLESHAMYILVITLIGMVVCLLVIGFGAENDLAPVWILGTKSKKEALEFVAFGIGGVLAAISAVSINRRANAQARHNELIEKRHINDQFQHATINLGHEKRRVRITSFHLFILATCGVLAVLIACADQMIPVIWALISYHAEFSFILLCLLVIFIITRNIVIMPQSHSKNSIKARFQRSDFVFWGTAFMWSIVVLMLLMFVLAIRSDNMLMWISNLLGTANEIIATEKVVAINTVKSETLKFIGLGISGMVVAIGAIAVNRRADAEVANNRLTEKGHINDRFQHATGNLGSNETHVRIASFYQFYYLASKDMGTPEKTKEFRQSIFEILCSYLRAISKELQIISQELSTISRELRAISSESPHSKNEEKGYIKSVKKRALSSAQNTINNKKIMRGRLIEEHQILFDMLFKGKFKPGNATSNKKKEGLIHDDDEFETNLQKTHLLNIDFLGANFSYVNLSGAIFSQKSHASPADLTGVNFLKAKLSHANLSKANLSGANLTGAILPYANLTKANLSGANLTKANLSGAKLVNTTIWGAVFSGANFSGANILNVNLSDTNLVKVDLSGAILSGVDFVGKNLSGAILSGANLSNKNLSNAILSGVDLSNAILSGANLSGANLAGANLASVDFQKTRFNENTQLKDVLSIKNADFRGAKMGDRPIRKDDIPANKGEYYANWNTSSGKDN